MNKKGIIKLKVKGKSRIMHYIALDDKLLVLSLNDNFLKDGIKENGSNSSISFGLKEEDYLPVSIKIVENKEEVKALLDMKNTYFKEYDERLIMLELTLI